MKKFVTIYFCSLVMLKMCLFLGACEDSNEENGAPAQTQNNMFKITTSHISGVDDASFSGKVSDEERNTFEVNDIVNTNITVKYTARHLNEVNSGGIVELRPGVSSFSLTINGAEPGVYTFDPSKDKSAGIILTVVNENGSHNFSNRNPEVSEGSMTITKIDYDNEIVAGEFDVNLEYLNDDNSNEVLSIYNVKGSFYADGRVEDNASN